MKFRCDDGYNWSAQEQAQLLYRASLPTRASRFLRARHATCDVARHIRATQSGPRSRIVGTSTHERCPRRPLYRRGTPRRRPTAPCSMSASSVFVIVVVSWSSSSHGRCNRSRRRTSPPCPRRPAQRITCGVIHISPTGIPATRTPQIRPRTSRRW